MEKVKAALIRVERIEADLVKIRDKGYGEIWKLTGSLNLFGPITEVDSKDFSTKLKNWYFEHGRVLTTPSKNRYFLVQEVLNFGIIQSISLMRPADKVLYTSKKRPVKILRKLRSERQGIKILDDEDRYDVDELEKYVSDWKNRVPKVTDRTILAEDFWMILQLVLSAFRTGIVDELGTREMVREGDA